VQQCDDIVHVDPLIIKPSTRMAATSENTDANRLESRSNRVSEIMASTKAYPSWWADMDESRSLKRRKSLGETVLERNVCFVDTSGHGDYQRDPVVDYIEESFWHAEASDGLSETERLNMVSGKGASLVDVVLFVFSGCKLPQTSTGCNIQLTSSSTALGKRPGTI
jgi:hypothetical protein